MNDIVVGVRLNADGSGLVGQLKLSNAELDRLRIAEKGATDAARDLSQATDQASKSQARATQGAREASDASVKLTRNLGLQRAGWQSAGFQVQDFFASYSSGTRLSVIFAQQSGQLASAIAMIAQSAEGTKGKLGGLASFLGGGWGIALGIAVSAGTSIVSMLLDVDDASEKVKLSTSGVADSQSILASVMDITTGKMKAQTDAALGLAFAQAQLNRVNAQKAAAEFRTEVASLQRPDRKLRGGMGGGLWFEDVAPGAQKSIAQGILTRLSDPSGKAGIGTADAVQRLDNLRKAGALTDDAYAKAAASVANLGVELENVKIADATLRMLQGDGTTADRGLLLKPSTKKPAKDNSADKAAREAERLATFSDRAAEAVARMSSEYDSAPRDIDRAGTATRSLDAIIGDVNERLSSSKNLTAAQRAEFEKIRDSAEKLKPVIQNSLVRPLLDMAQGQERQIALNKLTLAGRQAESDALQFSYALMDKMGVESEDQLATELAKRGVTEDQVRGLYDNLAVMRQQTREMRVQQQMQQVFLSAVGDMRENTRLTVESLRKDGPKALGDFAKRSLDVFDRLFSEVATEKLFGGLFRDLEDQITGGDKISKMGDELADAVGRAAKDMKQTSGAIVDLGRAAAAATGMISGSSATPVDPSSAASGLAGGISRGIMPGDQPGVPPIADIIVTATKQWGFKAGFEGVFDDLNTGLKKMFTDIFGDKGLFGKSLSETLGRTFGNAALGGASGSLVTGALGIRGSGTGGMIGGALGGYAAEELLSKTLGSFAGPIGSIAGGIVGSVVGGLLKKTKSGAATITSVDGDATLSGNSGAFKQAASGAADSVQDGLSQIAERLGGAIGAFNVTIGQRHGDWRVREGAGSLKIAKGATEFDDDQASAIAYAIQLAVSQGAVTGLSAAVEQALRSSPDIEAALAEALKVQEVEQLLGGLGTEMAAQFQAFESQAKERVRIASQYGFDVVAIEKRNADDRVALVDQILTDRVGSLQALLDDLKFGNLAEGSVMDQRTALLAQIATTRADAEAGKDGAADKLASLTRQLVDSSRDNLGTAGSEYGADRTTAIDAAEAVIKAENERIKAAQGEQAATNAKLDEANKLAAEQVDYLSDISTALQALTAQGSTGQSGGGSGMADFYRTQEL
ncbi:hypothetical protein [uncultured Sphingobium sp.]|uniref:hypothetical protein n=1 Tax=uncultured Sphingobium sp. TaxID=316087 RepID=UPI00259B3CD0|nr:hypothetical protein [uncultured Sphingobium sp.]